MANGLIAERSLTVNSRETSYKIFDKTFVWEGVKVGHYRLLPGETSQHIHKSHHVYIPLAGSVTIEAESTDGKSMVRRPIPGQISVTPAGAKYSANWQEELEYVMVYLSQEYIARATIDFQANREAKIVGVCGPQDALIRSIGH